MAELNTFNQVLFVNGEPILVQDLTLNQIDTFCPSVLNHQCQLISPQLINNSTHSDELPTEMHENACNRTSLVRPDDTSVPASQSEQNELITVLSDGNNLECSTAISLTVEQAAQLGLDLNVNTIVDSNMDTDSNVPISGSVSFSGQGKKEVNENLECGAFMSPNSESSETDNQGNNLEPGSQNNSDPDILGKSIFLNPITYSSDNSSLNQQITLVPQILNGVLTYTLQLSNEANHIDEDTHSNDLYTASKAPVTSQETEQVRMDLDSSNTSSRTDVPFKNSTGGISQVTSETTDTTILKPRILNVSSCCSIDTEEYIGALDIASSNTQSMAYLNIAETLTGKTGAIITSTVDTHAERLSCTTQESPIVNQVTEEESSNSGSSQTILNPLGFSTFRKIVRNQGESLLLKHRNIVLQQGVNSKPGNMKPSENVKNELGTTFVIKQFEIGGKIHAFISEAEPIKNKEMVHCNESTCNDDAFLSSTDPKPSEDDTREKTTDPAVTATIITPPLGELPEEVSVVLSRLPIKTDDKKPLGSGENPIKLVQRGTTFHSVQALSDDHISMIKPILMEKLDSKTPSKNVIYDPASNTRIIYRIISPSDLNLRQNGELPKKRGRPRKLRLDSCIPEENTATEEAPPRKKIFSRTRSGRLSRPPKHMVRDFKHLKRPDGSDGASSDYQSENEAEPSEAPSAVRLDLLPGLVARRTLKRNISKANVCPTCNKVYLGYDRMKRHFDNFPDHGSTEFLNAIRNSANADSEAESNRVNGGNGLNRKRRKGRGRFPYFSSTEKRARLKEALSCCNRSDLAEVAGPAVARALSLWEMLMLRIDAVRDESRVATLYSELRLLLTKLRKMANQLFRPLDHQLAPDSKQVTIKVEDDMANVLNLPCGVYVASDDDLNDPVTRSSSSPDETSKVPQTVKVCESDSREEMVDDPKEETDIDEVPQQYLLSDGMIIDADERGLINVDDIVSERLHNFTSGQTSSVDEIMKGLNELDPRDTKMVTDDLMEEFAIVARRTHVSASTEDLMKSLEHFDSELSHHDPTSSLDRDAFDQNVSSVDTLDFEVLSREFHSNNR